MCGLVGFFKEGLNEDGLRADVTRMARAIQHRGPDDEGYWVDPKASLALGHRRLSIIDLSVSGHQPMTSGSGRYIIVYNGEVYNFPDLRKRLEAAGCSFRGTSDTEVVLAAIETWGLREAVSQFVGMFAFALWDRQERTLHLVRDRLGIKPLYFGWIKGTLLFGSELKALQVHSGFEGEIDQQSLNFFLRLGYIPAPHSIYRGINKVNPGCIVSVKLQDNPSGAFEELRYWSAAEKMEAGMQAPFTGSEEEALEELEKLLREAVLMRMVSDVPLGTFLSGGIDSSLVTALMQSQSSRPVQTFSIGFHEDRYNEAQHAKAVANHLGTSHTEEYVTPEKAMSVIPRLADMYDEPFADSSQIPTFLVSEMTRSHVTVSLSGDGGDELFGGYNRYFWGNRLLKLMHWLPGPIRPLQRLLVTGIPPHAWDKILGPCGFALPRKIKAELTGSRLHRVAEVLVSKDAQHMYEKLASVWDDGHGLLAGDSGTQSGKMFQDMWSGGRNAIQNMMFIDSVTYLPDDILAKVDRASMAVSLESRVPILDHRVFEMAWRLPLSMKIAGNSGKKILKKMLNKYIPDTIMDRPKMGFGVPIDSWLKGPLRDWAENYLNESRLKDEGFFNPTPIRKRWKEHLEGSRPWHQQLWAVLMFEQWLEKSKKEN